MVARISAERSVTATSTLVTPRSTARTHPARLLNCSSVGGRPPVLQPRPPSASRLAAISWSTRALTVFREAPVRATSSARLRARPVRTWRRSAPAEADVCTTGTWWHGAGPLPPSSGSSPHQGGIVEHRLQGHVRTAPDRGGETEGGEHHPRAGRLRREHPGAARAGE